jgi:4-hydroxyacetophenone monooxygenase
VVDRRASAWRDWHRASAAQLGPAIAPDAAQLTVFQRSRHWVLPNHFRPVEDGVRWGLRHIPH